MILEFGERIERCTPKRLAGEDREPDFDLIEPGRADWREMEMHVRMALQRAIVLRLVDVEIVEDDIDLAPLVLSDDAVHEVEKLQPSPPLILASRHFAGSDVEGGEERRRAVPLIVVRLARQRPFAESRCRPDWDVSVLARRLFVVARLLSDWRPGRSLFARGRRSATANALLLSGRWRDPPALRLANRPLGGMRAVVEVLPEGSPFLRAMIAWASSVSVRERPEREAGYFSLLSFCR